MSFSLKGRWAVVTGASAGIGSSLCQEMAKAGCNLVLVARREALLEQQAQVLQEQTGIETRVIAMDLGQPEAAERLAEALTEIPISVVINNAGFGISGNFEAAEWTRIEGMIDLNIRFLTAFCHVMIPRMLARKEACRIMNVGSVAGYQGVSNFAAYAASKAYVNNLSEGLNWELRNTNIVVTCLQPGQTSSEFFKVADMEGSKTATTGLQTSDEVAREGVRAMVAGKPLVVTGWINKIKIFSLRFSPRWTVGWVIRYLFNDLGGKR